jgi:hypothetical protein
MIETVNQSTAQASCAHPMCKCTVPGGQRYCSEHCEKEVAHPSRTEGSRCGCGHAPCAEGGG